MYKGLGSSAGQLQEQQSRRKTSDRLVLHGTTMSTRSVPGLGLSKYLSQSACWCWKRTTDALAPKASDFFSSREFVHSIRDLVGFGRYPQIFHFEDPDSWFNQGKTLYVDSWHSSYLPRVSHESTYKVPESHVVKFVEKRGTKETQTLSNRYSCILKGQQLRSASLITHDSSAGGRCKLTLPSYYARCQDTESTKTLLADMKKATAEVALNASADAKKMDRMIRNRLSAKRSREIAKNHVQLLEKNIAMLSKQAHVLATRLALVEAENAHLRVSCWNSQVSMPAQAQHRSMPAMHSHKTIARGCREPAALLSLQWMPLLLFLSATGRLSPQANTLAPASSSELGSRTLPQAEIARSQASACRQISVASQWLRRIAARRRRMYLSRAHLLWPTTNRWTAAT